MLSDSTSPASAQVSAPAPRLRRWAVATAALLLAVFVAMQLSNEVRWSLSDFVIVGALLFGTGAAYELVVRRGGTRAYRIAAALALVTTLLLVWANLAVGLVGAGASAANLAYGLLPVFGVVAAVFTRGRARGLAYVTAALAVACAGIAGFAYASGLADAREVLLLAGGFGGLYGVAALLFWRAASR